MTELSIFKGLITADAVTAHASAGTGYSGAGGNVNGSTVPNLEWAASRLIAAMPRSATGAS